MPISTPVNAARSTTKLFNKADHALKATGMAMDINISNATGVRKRLKFKACPSSKAPQQQTLYNRGF
jgi:hypothetical protein